MKAAPVEIALAEKVSTALKATPALYGFKVYANWGKAYERHPFDEGGCQEPCVLDVNVRQRRYESFTGVIATFEIVLSGRVDFSSRVMHDRPEDAYLEIAGIIEDWHFSLPAVKEALGCEFFDPVGLRFDGGGELEIDGNTKALNFTIPFTIKGRIKRQ